MRNHLVILKGFDIICGHKFNFINSAIYDPSFYVRNWCAHRFQMFLHKFVMMCKLNDYFSQEIDFFFHCKVEIVFFWWNLVFVMAGCWQIYKAIDDGVYLNTLNLRGGIFVIVVNINLFFISFVLKRTFFACM